MGTTELVLRIASTGAVGVACLALYLWHRSFSDLLKFAGGTDHHQGDGSQLKLLAQQLTGYQKIMVGALVAAVLVQLATPLLEKANSPVHTVRLSVQPIEDALTSYMPEVRHESQPLAPKAPGMFEVRVDKPTNFDVNVLKMRDRINALKAINDANAKVMADLTKKATGSSALGL